jgi:superfamily II DNA or RNA helicase
MKAILTNKLIVIKDPTPEVDSRFAQLLSYKDKAKEYQLRRLASNSWSKGTQYYQDLKNQISNSLLYRLNDGHIAMSSGFYHLVENMNIEIEDRRKDTGKDIPLPWIKKPYDLRDYQEEALELMLDNWRGVINFATGLGKTLLAVHAIKKFRKRTLIIVPGTCIGDQFYKDLVEAFGENKVGYFGDGSKKIRDITVGIAASVSKNTDKFKTQELGLIIADEAHHTPADTFYSIAKELGDVGRIFGLTATDFRSDGKDIMITAGCGNALIRRDIVWGVANKWLAEPIFIMRNVDTSGHRQYKNDKLKNYKSHVLNCQPMKDQIRSDIQKFIAAGKRVMCLVDEVAHGHELSQQLGIPFATGLDKKSQDYVDQFNAKKIMGLIGTTGKVGEGVDTKPVDVLVLANFMASKGRVIQAVGRGLRKVDGKEVCIILDYCPTASDMLSRHAQQRLGYYREITNKVKVI